MNYEQERTRARRQQLCAGALGGLAAVLIFALPLALAVRDHPDQPTCGVPVLPVLMVMALVQTIYWSWSLFRMKRLGCPRPALGREGCMADAGFLLPLTIAGIALAAVYITLYTVVERHYNSETAGQSESRCFALVHGGSAECAAACALFAASAARPDPSVGNTTLGATCLLCWDCFDCAERIGDVWWQLSMGYMIIVLLLGVVPFALIVVRWSEQGGPHDCARKGVLLWQWCVPATVREVLPTNWDPPQPEAPADDTDNDDDDSVAGDGPAPDAQEQPLLEPASAAAPTDAVVLHLDSAPESKDQASDIG